MKELKAVTYTFSKPKEFVVHVLNDYDYRFKSIR
jgi:hypothetical protein